MKKIILLLFILVLTNAIMAQDFDSTNQAADKIVIKNTVEKFLFAAGNYDAEAISTLFTSKANISGYLLKMKSGIVIQ